MLPSEMKALRSFHTNKHIFLFKPSKTPTSLSFISRQFHYSRRAEDSGLAVTASRNDLGSSGSEKDTNGRQVWSYYSPALGRIVTERSGDKNDGRKDAGPGGSSFSKETEVFETDRTYGSAKRKDSGEVVEQNSLQREQFIDAHKVDKGLQSSADGKREMEMGVFRFPGETEVLETDRTYGSAKNKEFDEIGGHTASQRNGDKISKGVWSHRHANREAEVVSSFPQETEVLQTNRTYGSAKEKELGEIGGSNSLQSENFTRRDDSNKVLSSSMDGRREVEPGVSSLCNQMGVLETDRNYRSANKENLGVTDGHSGLQKGDLSDGEKIKMGLQKYSDGNGEQLKENSRGHVMKKIMGSGGRRMGLNSSSGDEDQNLSAKADSSFRVGSGDTMRSMKKKKTKSSWVCADCGHTDAQWWGLCPKCEKLGTMKKFVEANVEGGSKVNGIQVSDNITRSWLPQRPGEVKPLRLADVNQGVNDFNWRIPLSGPFGSEVARVLGGGLVPGSLVLIGGDPGVGKSTLLLQIAGILAEGKDLCDPAPVVYVSGEESVEQIGNRAYRLSIEAEDLFLYSTTDIEDMLEKTQQLSPRALVVDSIQTAYLKGVTGSAGGLSQVKECTSALLYFAKKTKIPVLLIGHVTKTGDIAGPRVLEHIVDVVLYMEGEKHTSHRLLRPVKNRFGSTDELGVFEMSPLGLQAVANPSEIFLDKERTDSKILAGLAVSVVMDGSRSFLIEIQALCVTDPSGLTPRHVNGIPPGRADLIISVLMKQAGLMLQPNAIFLNVISGMSLIETAGDVAVAAAICSSFLESPIPNDMAFVGEIGLAGEIRMVTRLDKRVATLAKLGYKKCVVPKSAEDFLMKLGFEGMEIIGCNNVKDVIDTVFQGQR